MKIYCENAAVHGSSTTAKPTESTSSTATKSAEPTDDEEETENAEDGEDSGSAGGLVMNAGAVMAAVAGVMAVVV